MPLAPHVVLAHVAGLVGAAPTETAGVETSQAEDAFAPWLWTIAPETTTCTSSVVLLDW